MPIFWLLLLIVAIAAVGYFVGRQRAMASVGHDGRNLHSLPVYYGANAFMKSIVPAAGLILVWLLAQPLFIDNRVSQMIPESEIREGSSRGLVMAEVRRTADGLENAVRAGVLDDETARNARADFTDMTQRLKDAGQVVTNQITQPVLRAAQTYRALSQRSNLFMTIVSELPTGGYKLPSSTFSICPKTDIKGAVTSLQKAVKKIKRIDESGVYIDDFTCRGLLDILVNIPPDKHRNDRIF